MTPDPLRRDQVARLDHLDLGHFDVGPGKRLIPISGWLVTTAKGRRLLIDTGFPAAYASDERGMAQTDGLDSFGRLVSFEPRHTIAGALARHDLTASHISHVLLSHSHIDHIGGLPLFTHAEIILGAAERALPRPLYFAKAPPMDWPKATYRALTKTTDICGGLRMIATPGHTVGHMSFLIKTPTTTTILAIDAINRATEPAEGFPDAMDPAKAAHSAATLFALQKRHGATMIYGHEPL